MSALVLFEPANLTPYGPLTLLQSVGELRYGIYSNIERVKKLFTEEQIHLWVRPVLSNDHMNRYQDIAINQTVDKQAVFLNAALPAQIFPKALATLSNEDSAVLIYKGTIIAAKPGVQFEFSSKFHDELTKLKAIEFEWGDSHSLPVWIWDYLDLINSTIDFDLNFWKADNSYLAKFPDTYSTVNEKNIFIHNTAQVSKFVHLDASHGPIIIDKDAKISQFSSLVGPLYIGKRSTLKPSTFIRNSAVSAVCNLGGEIKGSIIHPHSNKSHEGFLGDSIIGSWVNMGAGTTTSNLKNNYNTIRVSWDGNHYDSGRQFLGSILGDHTKTAIGVRLNTGTVIGAFCNIFQADFAPQAIPSFSWGNGTHELDKAIKTAQIAMKRRGLELTASQLELIQALADDTTPFTHYQNID